MYESPLQQTLIPNVKVKQALAAVLAAGPLTMREMQRKLVQFSSLAVEAAAQSLVKEQAVTREILFVSIDRPQPFEPPILTLVQNAPERMDGCTKPMSVRDPNSVNARVVRELTTLEVGDHFDFPATELNVGRMRQSVSVAVCNFARRAGRKYRMSTLENHHLRVVRLR